MQYLKALVIGMGVLIIISVGLLVYGLVNKTGSKPSTDSAVAEDQLTGFGEIALEGNAGCRIRQAIPDGRRLVLHLAGMDDTTALRCQKIVIIDMAKGTVMGTIILKP